ncbi:hypothetical protein O9993_02330 [Vibrio lentus]|nr:hypothetical protein [Vibrio lentus]
MSRQQPKQHVPPSKSLSFLALAERAGNGVDEQGSIIAHCSNRR